MRHGDLLVAHVDHLHRQGPDLADDTLDTADGDEVALFQRARIHHHESAHELRHHARGAQRDHQAQQHAQPLEGLGLGAGKVGVGGRQRKPPQQEVQHAARGLYGLGVQERHAQPASLHVAQEGPQHLLYRSRHEHHDNHGHQPGQRVRHTAGQPARELAHEARQPVSPRKRPGEAVECHNRACVERKREQEPHGCNRGAQARQAGVDRRTRLAAVHQSLRTLNQPPVNGCCQPRQRHRRQQDASQLGTTGHPHRGLALRQPSGRRLGQYQPRALGCVGQ